MKNTTHHKAQLVQALFVLVESKLSNITIILRLEVALFFTHIGSCVHYNDVYNWR